MAQQSKEHLLNQPVDLPCGKAIPNRFAKASLYEALSDWWGGEPNEELYGLYRLWALGEWGMILTGNFQVSQQHLSIGRDVIIPRTLTEANIEPFRKLAEAIHTPHLSSSTPSNPTRSLAIIQLSHAGRQSPRFLGGRPTFQSPLGASTVPMVSRANSRFGRTLYKLLFVPPKEASDEELEDVIQSFVRGAEMAMRSGFDGCQLHCAHGYLLAQFMSPKTNTRPPPYGPPESLYLLRTIIARIRALVPPSFVLGVKLNASDYVKGGLSEDIALGQLKTLAELGVEGKEGQKAVDFIEISGGDYETSAFLDLTPSRRQAFFETFSRQAMELMRGIEKPPRIMLTGGFTTTDMMEEALGANHADIIGIGRASISDPLLPRRLFLNPSTPLPLALSAQANGSAPKTNGDSSGVKHDSEDDVPVLAPNPPAAWWQPPDTLANASVWTAQWTALLHRRAAQGIELKRISDSSSSSETDALLNESLPMDRPTWRLPLTDSKQHEPAIRSILEFMLKADVIDRIVWIGQSVGVLALCAGLWVGLGALRKWDTGM